MLITEELSESIWKSSWIFILMCSSSCKSRITNYILITNKKMKQINWKQKREKFKKNLVINWSKLRVDQNSHGSKRSFRSWWLYSLLNRISKQIGLSWTKPALVHGYLSKHLVSPKEWKPAVLTQFCLPIGNCIKPQRWDMALSDPYTTMLMRCSFFFS